MKRLFYILVLALLYTNIYSQNISGTVYGQNGTKKEPLAGAIVKWINTTKGTLTDENGKFGLAIDGITDKRLVISQVGYGKDTIETGDNLNVEIILKQNLVTEEIKVESEKKSTYFENFDAKTEVISSNELVKDACCDLSGCFGRNSSVDVAVTDILTDSKELKVLGLEGVYTQVLLENMPVITGINTKYSVSSIPGTLIDKIMVTKGANSVLQGYENISGIINVLLKDSKTTDRLFFNAFMNSILEKQFNVNLTHDFSKKWNSILTLHSTQKSNRVDENKDGFLDNPLTTRYMMFNKWALGNIEDKTQFSFAGKLWIEDRVGGEKAFDPENDEGSNTVYGQSVKIKSVDVYSRFGRQFKNETGIKVLASHNYYDIISWYGTTKYNALQNVFNTNLIYEFSLGGENIIKAGASYKFEKISEKIEFTQNTTKTYSGNFVKKESVPGVFIEHSINLLDEKASIMSGIRWDYHNEHKNIITPRILIRYQPVLETVIRASVGTGFRTIELFNEYSTIMASSRDIIITGKIQPEKMLNYGVDLLQYFDFKSIAGSFNLDIYRTEFSNKVIPDYDSDPTKVFITNSDSKAYSNIIQAELNINFLRYFDIKTAYKYIEIKYTQNGVLIDQPFNSKHRVLSTFSYSPSDKSWIASFGLQWFGKSRLPNTETNPEPYRRPLESEPYTMLNAQLSKNFRVFEIYAGADNLLDYTQENPIISADNPFGPYFDTSFIYGPTKGREFYAGIRLKIN